MEELTATEIAWELIFGERLEDIPDPNIPGNIPIIKVKQREHLERFKKFVNGTGAPLWEAWSKKVKRETLGLLSSPKADECTCPICQKIKEVRTIFHLLIEAEKILREEKVNAR